MTRRSRVGSVGSMLVAWSAAALFLLAPVARGGQQSWAFAGDSLAGLENRIAASTNAERAKNELSDLRIDPVVARVAREHSEEMADLDYFSHESPTEGRRTMTDRLKSAQVPYTYVGENIAYYEGYSLADVASQVITDWMDSPGHRANILNADYTCIGVGAATKGRKTYVTQVFAALRR